MKVEATKFDGKAADMNVKLENDVKAGTGPCLAQVGYAEIPKLYTSGLLTDVSAQAEKYKEHFSEGSMSLMTVGKTVVGLPQDSGPLVYFYNKAAFDQLGLKVPTTSAELAEVARKAAEQGKYALAFEPDEAPNTLAGQAAAAGAQWFSAENDKWKVNVSSPETAKVSSFWQGGPGLQVGARGQPLGRLLRQGAGRPAAHRHHRGRLGGRAPGRHHEGLPQCRVLGGRPAARLR